MQIRAILNKLWAPGLSLPFISRATADDATVAHATPPDAALRRVALVIADISGYTGFLQFHKTSLLHASQIINELLDTVIEEATHPLILNKLEGDAVLLYAELSGDEAAAIRDVSRQTQKFFAAFRAKALQLSAARSGCSCEACRRIRNLRLKAVLHAGTVALLRVRGHVELVGEDVILAHRLLKNSIEADEYLLMTQAFHCLAGSLPGDPGTAKTEECEGLGRQEIRVFFPAST